MSEFTLIEIGLLAVTLLLGAVLGWIYRADRCAKEKIAMNASWQQQIESQQSEHDRLAGQKKSLMEQISQYQASHKDSAMRAKELSDSLKEAFGRRDELQRQIKDIRSNLEAAVTQRDHLQTNIRQQALEDKAGESALKEKDEKIFGLSRELESWQERVPPLVERFRERDEHAKQLEVELEEAHNKIAALQVVIGSEQTRIEPIDANSLPDGMDASNEPHAQTSVNKIVANQDTQGFASGAIGEDESFIPESHFETNTNSANEDTENVEELQGGDEPAAETADAAREQIDDLKKIKGVGPAIERTLNELGIHLFYQIAELSEPDIDRVAQRLKGFRSRIYREDWIGQARNLQYQKDAGLN
jgi:predicted flap endonuclease-1-like 5' DNA nuclease